MLEQKKIHVKIYNMGVSLKMYVRPVNLNGETKKWYELKCCIRVCLCKGFLTSRV